MANPAELLLKQLTRWRENRQSAAGLADQRMAARHIEAIDELLSEMSAANIKVTLYRRYFDTWATLVYRHPQAWQSGTNTLKDDAALENLEHLADRMEDFLPQLRDGGLDEIRASTERAAVLLDEDDSIDPLLKLHVKQVIAHLEWCIDNYTAAGDFSLQDATQRLIATMMRAGATSRHPDRWKAWLNTIAWPFTVNIASAIPAQALAQLMLGS